jgi:hypothetical protein
VKNDHFLFSLSGSLINVFAREIMARLFFYLYLHRSICPFILANSMGGKGIDFGSPFEAINYLI